MGWDKQLIVRELRRWHRQNQDLCSRALRRVDLPLYGAARHHFGTYRQAIEAAGLDYQHIRRLIPGRWTRQTVARELRRLYRQGQALHHAALEKTRPELVQAAYRNFGSYRRAVAAAGLDYTRIRVRPMPSWTKQRVVAELRQLHRQGHPLWKRALRHICPYLERAARRCFGSYQRAGRAAGIDPAALKPPSYRIWSPQRIVQELQQLDRQDRSLLKPVRLEAHWPQLLRACRRQFGCYRRALQAAGIDYAQVARVTAPPLSPEQILYRLQHLEEQSADMRYKPMERKHPRLFNSARYRFGSYRAAMEAAGLEYPPLPPLRHWTRPLVLRMLRELDRQEADLRFRTMRKRHLPLFEAARHYFGTYLTAVKEAGIDYDQMVQEQLRRTLPARASRAGTQPSVLRQGGNGRPGCLLPLRRGSRR